MSRIVDTLSPDDPFAADPELLAAFRAGNRAALERVYRAYVRGVERYVRALARANNAGGFGQTAAVADLIQDIFVRAFSVAARRGFDGARPFAPYLMTIAHHCFVDAVRATRREVLSNPADIAAAFDQVVAVAPETSFDPKAIAVLNEFVAHLPAPLKGVYEQRFLLARSQEEAATALGVSRRRLRTGEERLRRGLRKALVRAGISLRELQDAGEGFPTRIPVRSVAEGSGS